MKPIDFHKCRWCDRGENITLKRYEVGVIFKRWREYEERDRYWICSLRRLEQARESCTVVDEQACLVAKEKRDEC